MDNGERHGATRLPVRKEDISRLTPAGYGRADVARLLDAADPAPLLDAASAWDAAAGLLATMHDDLRARAEALAADWDGAAAAACQFALRRIAGTARQLSRHAEQVRSALSAAARAQQHAKQQLAAFRARPTLLGGIEVGGSGARLLEDGAEPGLAEHLDATARQWLEVVYDGYRTALAALPDHVVFDLPGLVVPDPGVPAHSGAGGGGVPEGGGPAGPHAAADLGAAERAAAVPVEPRVAAGASYGGYATDVGTVLAGGLAAAPAPLDPAQPDGGSWQGAGSATAAEDPSGVQPGATAAGGPAEPPGGATAGPPAGHAGPVGAEGWPLPTDAGPVADAGVIVGAAAEAVGGEHRHAGAHPGEVPGPAGGDVAPVPPGVQAPSAPATPVVDAPYVAATIADAVAAAAHQHDPAAMPGSPPGSNGQDGGPAVPPLPDARPAEPQDARR